MNVLVIVPLIENMKAGVSNLAIIKLPIIDFNIPIKRASFNPKKIRVSRINMFASPRRTPGIGTGKKLSTTNNDIEAAVKTERKAILFSDCIVFFSFDSYYYSVWNANNTIPFF